MRIDMLTMWNIASLNDKGYQSLYASITTSLHSKKLKRSILPTPYNLAMARKLASNSIVDMQGGYKWIENTMPMSSSKDFVYSKFNNIYIKI